MKRSANAMDGLFGDAVQELLCKTVTREGNNFRIHFHLNFLIYVIYVCMATRTWYCFFNLVFMKYSIKLSFY